MYRATLIGHQKVAFRTSGTLSGFPALVLLHGFCEDASVWDDWAPSLSAYGLIRVDLPGFGQSDPARQPGIEHYAAAVKAVLDELGISSCVMIGHSMGGYTALAFAEQWPERIVGLGLIHSHPFADQLGQKEQRLRGIEMIQNGKKDLYVSQLFPNLFTDFFKKQYPLVVERLVEKAKDQSAEGIIAALNAMMQRPDRTALLAQLPCPLLLLLGRHDTLIPFERVLAIADQAQQTDLHLLEEAAHMAMFETPETGLRLVENFYRRCVLC